MTTHGGKLVRALMCAIMIVTVSPLQLLAQSATPTSPAPPATLPPTTPPAAASAGTDAALVTARELIESGDYDHAIEMLQNLIGQLEHNTEFRREAYLLLIKSFVYIGNDFRPKEQGRSNMILNYDHARKLIKECLQIRELRHTYPEPESDYPKEMVTAFKEVRGQIFGSFRVTNVTPAGSVVLFDADTLRALPGEEALGDVDLAVGSHLVVVRNPGYRDQTEEITIAPGITEARTYQLDKRRGAKWYATRVPVALGLTVWAAIEIFGPSTSPGVTADPPLGGPPPPPTRAR